MPPVIKVKKEDIIKAGYLIAKEEGMEGINARSIARKLKCSIQPIFSNFKNMEDLKQEIIKCAYQTYSNYIIEGSKQDRAYKSMGKSYIKFAQDYPKLFQLLFMSEAKLNSKDYLNNDIVTKTIYEKGKEISNLDEEEMKKFHFKMWIFTHGIATLIATNTCEFKEQEIDEMLKEVFNGLLSIKEN